MSFVVLFTTRIAFNIDYLFVVDYFHSTPYHLSILLLFINPPSPIFTQLFGITIDINVLKYALHEE
ncbi:MAG: hypothetical protein KJP09_06325, partial [Bacteroidia bacterium]|nr:hypothetical protein [Bacteroidia bacterium]